MLKSVIELNILPAFTVIDTDLDKEIDGKNEEAQR